jgi:hypothetical protein
MLAQTAIMESDRVISFDRTGPQTEENYTCISAQSIQWFPTTTVPMLPSIVLLDANSFVFHILTKMNFDSKESHRNLQRKLSQHHAFTFPCRYFPWRAEDLEPIWARATSRCRPIFSDFGEAPHISITATDRLSRPRLLIPFSEEPVYLRAQIREGVADIARLRLQALHLS